MKVLLLADASYVVMDTTRTLTNPCTATTRTSTRRTATTRRRRHPRRHLLYR